jgi:heme oxygenase
MEQLKVSTGELHAQAERHPFQQAMMRGDLPQAAYADYLEQMRTVHTALDAALRDLAQRDERFSAVIRDFHYHVGYLREDMDFFSEAGQAATSTVAADGEAARIAIEADAHPMHVLGAHYVLEGSKNGAVYIAARLREVYKLNGHGLRYLTAYGPDQRRFWAEFKVAMDALGLPAADCAALIAGAAAMFAGIIAIFDDLSDRWLPAMSLSGGPAA